ncbi:hypothetical protein KKA53_05365 [Candidatus Dependentiae bacterium]|nr:hypothetical protein [Candidatus Dependentiae bacterium]
MSKGPGKLQRLILAVLTEHEAFYLRDLLGWTYTKAQYNALLRAANQLERAGKIGASLFAFGEKRYVVHRIGTIFTGKDRQKVEGMSKCGEASVREAGKHL